MYIILAPKSRSTKAFESIGRLDMAEEEAEPVQATVANIMAKTSGTESSDRPSSESNSTSNEQQKMPQQQQQQIEAVQKQQPRHQIGNGTVPTVTANNNPSSSSACNGRRSPSADSERSLRLVIAESGGGTSGAESSPLTTPKPMADCGGPFPPSGAAAASNSTGVTVNRPPAFGGTLDMAQSSAIVQSNVEEPTENEQISKTAEVKKESPTPTDTEQMAAKLDGKSAADESADTAQPPPKTEFGPVTPPPTLTVNAPPTLSPFPVVPDVTLSSAMPSTSCDGTTIIPKPTATTSATVASSTATAVNSSATGGGGGTSMTALAPPTLALMRAPIQPTPVTRILPKPTAKKVPKAALPAIGGEGNAAVDEEQRNASMSVVELQQQQQQQPFSATSLFPDAAGAIPSQQQFFFSPMPAGTAEMVESNNAANASTAFQGQTSEGMAAQQQQQLRNVYFPLPPNSVQQNLVPSPPPPQQEQQQQQMEKIFICPEVCLETFAFINPFGLGLKMALINRRFDKLVDMHFVLREWSLCSMEICRANDENGAHIVNKDTVEPPQPIPLEKFPDRVIGFKRIEISYFDPSVMEFLRRIRRLFDSSGPNVWIDTYGSQTRSWEIITQIWPLVSDNIDGLHLFPAALERLRQLSPTILRNCAHLRSIVYIGRFPEFPGEDNAGASSSQALARWLFTPRGDGLPKLLECSFIRARMDRLRRSFANALEPANFVIRFVIDRDDDNFVPFELKNNWTGERLTTLRLLDKGLVVRCPIHRDEDKWAKWEEEAFNGNNQPWNRIAITFGDSDIGDGSVVGAKEDPSEPTE